MFVERIEKSSSHFRVFVAPFPHPQLDFWVQRGCYKDLAADVGWTMQLRLKEEALHRH